MSDTNTISADPVEMLATLTPERIQARLDVLDREAKALRVLLRSARAREREQDRAAVRQGVPRVAS